MKLKIHRGTGEVRYNLVEIATKATKVILDCGRDLPPNDGDLCNDIIDIPGLTSCDSAYSAVFVTQHNADRGDLIGCINSDIPIYMNKDTKNVLDVIADFKGAPLPRVDKYLEHGRKEQIGDISVLPVCVDHRVFGRMLLLIEAGGQKLLYTDGFKQIDPAYYAMLGNVDVLLCETMNFDANDVGSISFAEVEDEAARIMRQTNGQAFVLCSPTDAERVRHIERASRASGRTLAIDPFMKAIQEKVTSPLFVGPVGFLPYTSAGITPRIQKYISANNDVDFVDAQTFSSLEIVAKMTNLTFMVRPGMEDFLKRLDKLVTLTGSVLINFMWEGYEYSKPVKELVNLCCSLGIKIETLHACDFAYRKQLKTAIMRLEPDMLIPVQFGCGSVFLDYSKHLWVHNGVEYGSGEVSPPPR